LSHTCGIKLGAATLSITAFGILAPDILTLVMAILSITTLSIGIQFIRTLRIVLILYIITISTAALSIMTLSIMALS